MKLFYREHRGSMEDSLATTKEFKSLRDICNSICLKHDCFIEDVNISYYDDRCKQDLFIVKINKEAVGFLYEE